MKSPEEHLAELAFKHCEPVNALIELTTLCNYRCGHCYNFDRNDPTQKGDSGLSTSELTDLIEQIARLGVLQLSLSGGEPLLRKDITQLIQRAVQLGLFVKIKTNGSRITKSRLDTLMSAGLSGLDVTLYGFSAATHDAYVGVKGSFNQTIEAIKYASSLKQNDQLKLKVTVATLSHNEHEFHLRSELIQDLGLNIFSNMACHGRNDGDLRSIGYKSSVETRLKLIPVQENERMRFENSHKGDATSFRCGCARTSFAITADGTVVPCIEAPIPAGNIRNQKLKEIWDHSSTFERIRNLESEDWKTCHGCELTSVCTRRNCTAYKYDQNYTGADPEAGEITYQRYKPYGIGKPACLID